jgi:prevent-host-death family protein
MDINIHYAKTHFSKLIERVRLGEEITISKAGRPVAKLVPIAAPIQPRVPGSAKGAFSLPENLDDPLADEDLKDFHA